MDESSSEAAVREAFEETGLSIRDPLFIGPKHSIGASGRTYSIDCFVCETWSGSPRTFPTQEHAAGEWIALAHLSHMAPMGPATRWLATEIASRAHHAPDDGSGDRTT